MTGYDTYGDSVIQAYLHRVEDENKEAALPTDDEVVERYRKILQQKQGVEPICTYGADDEDDVHTT